MPLKCFRDHEPIFAFDMEAESAWDDLRRENASKRNLRLPCCDSRVTLRASKLGTKHFAHARRGACSTAPETAEHLLAKRIVVEGVRQAGWTPSTEAPGDCPGLGAWVADVMAEKGTVKVAFECSGLGRAMRRLAIVKRVINRRASEAYGCSASTTSLSRKARPLFA